MRREEGGGGRNHLNKDWPAMTGETGNPGETSTWTLVLVGTYLLFPA